jgi:hypothetical protein
MPSSAETLAAEALALFVRAAGDPEPALEAALAANGDCTSAHLLRAACAIAAKDRAAYGALDESLAALTRLEPTLDARERSHLGAARAWRAGAHEVAAAVYSGIAQRCPRDLLAIRLAQSCWFMLGRPRELHEVAAQALPHWREGMQGFDALLSMHAFGLEESGDLPRAEAVARHAVAVAPDNPSAIHAVAHALAGQGALHEGLHWMELHAAAWEGVGGMASHNAWHTALFHLALGRTDRALALHDAALAPALDRVGSDAADAAALLWRLHLQGVDVGARWRPVADAFALRPQPALWALVDVHAAMAFAAAGRERELDRLRSGLAASPDPAHAVARPIVDAMAAFAAGDRASARALLAPRRRDTWRLGGSRLQRDIVDMTLRAADQGLANAA